MNNIRRSFWGYNKDDVRNLISEKNQIIDAQQKDIDYLRKQNKQISSQDNTPAQEPEK